MTDQTAREAELINAIGERKLIYRKQENYSGEHREWEESMHLPKGTNLFREIVVDILPLIARFEAEALARGRMEGAKAMQERAAIHARCAFDDRPRRSGIDYQDGYDDATKAVAALILALDPAAIVKGLNDAENQ